MKNNFIKYKQAYIEALDWFEASDIQNQKVEHIVELEDGNCLRLVFDPATQQLNIGIIKTDSSSIDPINQLKGILKHTGKSWQMIKNEILSDEKKLLKS